jgi:hypothetical protein
MDLINKYLSEPIDRNDLKTRCNASNETNPFWSEYKDIKIIASLSKSILEVKEKKSNIVNKEAQYIASTVLIWNDLNIEKILNNLIRSGIAMPQIDIIKISLDELILEERITLFYKDYSLNDIYFIEEVELNKTDITSTFSQLDNAVESSVLSLLKKQEKDPTIDWNEKIYTGKVNLHEINIYHFFENLNNYINKFKGSYNYCAKR